MADLLFPLHAPTLSIAGMAARFPVGRIFCVGRNYAAHAREMGADPNAEPPIFFMKPASAALDQPARLAFPADTQDLHHEVELVIALQKGGAQVREDDALDLVFGYGVGVDLTKRDRQAQAKAKGQPWERSKSFDASAPCSALAPAAQIGHPRDGAIRLSINGASKQDATIADMIWSPAAIIAKLSCLWTLAPGDIIFTGTPEGVGAIPANALLTAEVAGVGSVSIQFEGGPA